MKIGIMNLFLVNNYGAVVQAYALEKAAAKLGHEVESIRYVQKISKDIYNRQCLRRLGLQAYLLRVVNFELVMKRREKGFEAFRAKHMNMSKRYTEANIHRIAERYDKIIVGSDIVWSTDKIAFDSNLFLPFIDEPQKKIAYAASLGNAKVEPGYEDFFNRYVSGFGAVSLREESSKAVVEPILKRSVPVMPDPVFLIPPEQWEQVAAAPKRSDKYIFVYQLRIDAKLVRLVAELKAKTGLKVVYCPFPMFSPLACTDKPWISVDSWLGYIKNAEYVVTDSFHAVCFSLIFQKKFFVKVSAFGTRIENVLKIHGLSKRMVTGFDSLSLTEEIDFAPVAERLAAERARGLEYLSGILTQSGENVEALPCERVKCTGCGACAPSCPHGAITNICDTEGFAYPQIDSELCTQCGLCRSVCPVSGERARTSSEALSPKTAYAARSNDAAVRARSASGGIFSAISDAVLQSGGTVYGAAFDEGFSVRHRRASFAAERDLFCGSKYVQSDMSGIYEAICADLRGGLEVMFSGLPCQCRAVRNYLAMKKCPDDRLTVVDIVCNSAASPLVWQEYLKLLGANGDISSVSFRSKEKGWHSLLMEARAGGKNISEVCNKKLSFLTLYHSGAVSRDSCLACRFKSLDRQGDITLGDFWGVERCKPELDDNKGTSLVFVNSEKGEALLSRAKSVTLAECAVESCVQPSLDGAVLPTDARRRFRNDCEKLGISDAIKKHAAPSKISVFKNYTALPLLHRTGLLTLISRARNKGSK